MRRSRRWIELRATTGAPRPEPGGAVEESDTPRTEPSPDEPGRDVAPPPPPSLSPFAELTALAARMAMAPILESGRYFRTLTAHPARSPQAGQDDDGG